jgi:hypothetical protein
MLLGPPTTPACVQRPNGPCGARKGTVALSKTDDLDKKSFGPRSRGERYARFSTWSLGSRSALEPKILRPRPETMAQCNSALKTDSSARVVIPAHAFVQNLRRGHYELAVDEPANLRVAAAFAELALAI